MKMNNIAKTVTVLAIAGIVGFAATSFAGWGRGGGGNCWGQGSGWGQRGYAPSGYQGNLSDEQITRLNKERQAFFEETRNLRENLYQKELELRSELAKEDPDAQKAAGLQAEISDLTAQLDQKRIDHRVLMQKENPELFAGRGYGKGGRGMGRGFKGRGMGQGFRSQGGGRY
jgi:Spy/CpxP family protein refolding chaperone